ncbi:MAG: DUF4437 domain-containing protein [Alphaproteobacteria bacterium]
MRSHILATTALALSLYLALPLASTSALADMQDQHSHIEVVPATAVDYQPLNPARGDASPQAGVLWGDIRQDVPTGTIIKFAPDFSSPPHIHNITYRGVVLTGAVHNDDPKAENMWMGPGSFWTQPAGESHITAAKPGPDGASAFLEILEGPYLVQPASEAFHNGEHPVNLEAGNVIWIEASDISWVHASPADDTGTAGTSAELAFLWGEPKDGSKNGSFVKLTEGFAGTLTGNDDWLRSVVIQGQITHQVTDVTESAQLEPGSYFGAGQSTTHNIQCTANQDCILYISTTGKYAVTAD